MEELVQVRMGTGGGGGRGEGFCDVGMVRVFCPTKNFGGNGLLEPPCVIDATGKMKVIAHGSNFGNRV